MIPTRSQNIIICLLLYWTNQIVSAYGRQKAMHPKPHVIIIVADDMGNNDVSFHGQNQILTPNIDALAYNGIILNRHYTAALCTPSRSALMTGKYPINTGMQHFVIPNDEPWGLPLNETIMPQLLKGAGYSTYIVGKWHLGFSRKAYTPTMRGFDYHFGYYGGYIDYYKHYLEKIGEPYAPGYDMRRNLNVSYETNGVYATDLFTDEAIKIIKQHDKRKPMFLYLPHLAPHAGNEDNPMQAPPDTLTKFAHIKDPVRRYYAAMIDKVDESVGRVMQTLNDTDMLQNSLVIFFSDNGGPTVGLHSNGASNHPLRGQKDSPWEGGLRTPAVVWSPYLARRMKSVTNNLIHITDWLPTIAEAAGFSLPPHLNIDGKSIWNALQTGTASSRWNILHNIDEILGYSSYTSNNWKLVNGTTNSQYDTWLGVISNETDPRANNYTGLIQDSVVNRILLEFNKINYMRNLTADKIKTLRESSTLQCPTRDSSDSECRPKESPCLFDIDSDPCERYNLASRYPKVLNTLLLDVEHYRLQAKRPVRVKADPACDPRNFNFTWTWWQDMNDAALTTRGDYFVHISTISAVFMIARYFNL